MRPWSTRLSNRSTTLAPARPRRLRRLIAEPTPVAPAARMPGLDALRSTSMVAVVAIHAAYAYVACRIPGIPWAVQDDSRGFAFDLLVWSSMSWAMPAFFALGGLGAAALWASRGPAGYARDRARRIGLPALLAGPAVLLPSAAVWIAGWLVSGRTNLRQIGRMVFVDREIRANLYGPAHLWFLEYFLLMLAAYGVARLAGRGGSARLPKRTLSPIGPFLLAIPTTLILFLSHRAHGLDSVVDLRNSFWPDPIRWAHHAWFFLVGTWLYRARGELSRLVRWSPLFLALAVPAFAIRASLLRADLAAPLHGGAAWASAASAALFAWLGLFGLIGAFLRLFHRPNAAFRYLSESSYWIYLTHFPIVGLIQVGLYPLPWPAWAKFGATLSVSFGVGLLTYQGLVRRTALGRLLGGKPKGALPAPVVSPPLAA